MDIPSPLVDEIESGRCVPFVGAGLSMNALVRDGGVVPDWRELTAALARTAGVAEGIGGPAVASAYERRYGRVQLVEAIRSVLRADRIEPGDAHVAFAELPFDTIYTTNFDLLLEDSLLRARRPFRSIVGELQMPFHGGPLTTTIVKMHGDLRHEEHMVVTAEDYAGYLERYPVIATHLSALLITRTPLFVGYSLSDPDFLHIREVVRSRLGKLQRMAYVVVFDRDPYEVEKALANSFHLINLDTKSGRSKSDLLSALFREIQETIDVRGGVKFRTTKPEAFEELSRETMERSTEASDSGPLLTSSSNLCFVMMPFASDLEWVYHDLIRPVVEKLGLSVLRADDIFAPGSITEQIRVAIQQSRLCIADVTNRNPNVLYEVGIAHTLGKPTVLLTQAIEDTPFDLRSLRVIVYEQNQIQVAQLALERSLQHVLGSDLLDEASRLMTSGSYRAAVALLSVFLSHSLAKLYEKYGDVPPKRPTLGQLLHGVSDPLKIAPGDLRNLQLVVQLRNRAVHGLEEVSRQEAETAMVIVRSFAEKYLVQNP